MYGVPMKPATNKLALALGLLGACAVGLLLRAGLNRLPEPGSLTDRAWALDEDVPRPTCSEGRRGLAIKEKGGVFYCLKTEAGYVWERE